MGLADAAVRYGSGSFAGLVTEPLLSEQFGVLCSPSLGLSAPEDLKRATLLHVEWKRPDMAPDWRRWARLAGLTGLAVDVGPRLTDDGHALQVAVAGHGVVVGSLVLAEPEIAAGLLVHPFGPMIAGETYHGAATPENMACAAGSGPSFGDRQSRHRDLSIATLWGAPYPNTWPPLIRSPTGWPAG